jgi:hypothetical protein
MRRILDGDSADTELLCQLHTQLSCLLHMHDAKTRVPINQNQRAHISGHGYFAN